MDSEMQSNELSSGFHSHGMGALTPLVANHFRKNSYKKKLQFGIEVNSNDFIRICKVYLCQQNLKTFIYH